MLIHRIIISVIYSALVVNFLVTFVASSGNFQLQVLKVDNPRNELASGHCCRVAEGIFKDTADTCSLPCSTAVRVCLREFQTQSSKYPADFQDMLCTLGNATSGVIPPNGLYKESGNPSVDLALYFDFAWTVSSLFICDLHFFLFFWGGGRKKVQR